MKKIFIGFFSLLFITVIYAENKSLASENIEKPRDIKQLNIGKPCCPGKEKEVQEKPSCPNCGESKPCDGKKPCCKG
ncbi:hypothetical protein [Persephonella sp.]